MVNETNKLRNTPVRLFLAGLVLGFIFIAEPAHVLNVMRFN
jgi:hypothetical protein